MPCVSKAQCRAMQAAAHGHSTLGIPRSAARKFLDATASMKDLPERKGKKKRKGGK